MVVYVKLEENHLDEEQQSDSIVSSQKISKKYSILLILVLLINTAVLIIIALNRTSDPMNQLPIQQNESNWYEYESASPLSMISDDSMPEDNDMNDELFDYSLWEDTDDD